MREANIFPSVILSLFSEINKKENIVGCRHRVEWILFLMLQNEQMYMIYFTRINNMTMMKLYVCNTKVTKIHISFDIDNVSW